MIDWQAVLVLALAIIGLIIYIAKMDGRLSTLEKHTDALWVKHDALSEKIGKDLTDIQKALAEIKGYLRRTNEKQP